MDDEYTGAQNHGVGAEPQALWERDNVNLPRGLKPHGHWDDRSPTACKSWGKTSYPGQVCDFQHFIYLYFIYFFDLRRRTLLSQSRFLEGGCVLDDLSNLLPLPGVGRFRVPAL